MGIASTGLGINSTVSRHGYLFQDTSSGSGSQRPTTVVRGATPVVPESPRQNTDFSTISNNVFPADDLFSVVPRYNNGRRQESGLSAFTTDGMSLIKSRSSVNGWGLDVGMGLMPMGYRYENSPASLNETSLSDGTFAFGGNLTAKLVTPIVRYENGSSLYGQLLTDLNANYVGNQTLVNLDANTLGVYWDNLPISIRVRTDIALKVYGKLNLYDSQEATNGDSFSRFYGAPDLRNNKIKAIWLQPMANFKWDDSASLMPSNMSVYMKLDPLQKLALGGLTFKNNAGTCASVEFGRNKNEENSDMGLYLGQKIDISKDLSMTFNLGTPVLFSTIGDPNRKAIMLGVSASYAFSILGNKFKGNSGILFNWDKDNRVRRIGACDLYNSGDTPFTGLAVEAAKSPHQYSQEIPFETGAYSVERDNTIWLNVGTNNNGVDGVAFTDPSGNWLDRSANVRVESVTVYDETLPPQNRLLAGAGRELVGMTLADINRGGIRVQLPTNSSGTVKYKINIKFSTNTGDFPKCPPAVPVCNINVKIRRE